MTGNSESRRSKTGLALYSLMLALWVGGIFIYTFLVTPLIFRSFGRDTAGMIVDKLFPFYFPYILIVAVLAFGFFLMPGRKRYFGHKLALTLLIVAILAGLFVNAGLYPEMKKVKKEIASFEKTPEDSPARRRFMVLHGFSMALNLLLLAEGTALIVIDSLQKKE